MRKGAGDDPGDRDAEEDDVGDVQVDEIDAVGRRLELRVKLRG